ncbi:MAG: VWA domain-containing protein [Myxococcota bacterium]|nr:VWA domain-containing protein [Myxococcota bacterium]
MQRWHITAGLTATAILAAVLVPTFVGEPAVSIPSSLDPTPSDPTPLDPPPPTPPGLETASAEGPLTLSAALDQGALLHGSSEARYLVMEVAAPDLPGEDRRPVHLSVVMDTSGSMNGEGKITNARMAAKELASLMRPADTLSLVTFSGTATVQLSTHAVTDAARIGRIVDSIRPEGGTNLHDGLSAGMAQLDRPDLVGVKRVVLLSDGRITMGISGQGPLAHQAGSGVAQGISVSALGLGLDYDEDLLAVISDAGGGSYRFVDRPGQLAQLFSDELQQMGSVIGREATVDVSLPSGVTLEELYGYDASLRPGGFGVFLGDVHGGETRKIVARVHVEPAATGRLGVAEVGLRYVDADSGHLTMASADVDALVTTDNQVAAGSLDNAVLAKATRARSAKLLDESARAWEAGDRTANRSKLEEAERLLLAVGRLAGNAGLLDDADAYRKQKEAFEAAPSDSDAGSYQVKKAKEVSRAQSRR